MGREGTVLGLPAPPPGPGTCRRCLGPKRDRVGQCWCCRRVDELLGSESAAAPGLMALRLCRPGDPLHRALRRYKDAAAISARAHFTEVLAELLGRFFSCHGDCLRRRFGGWDALCTVPSSRRGRDGVRPSRPFDTVVGQVPSLAGLELIPLGPGPGRAAHLVPAADAFVAPAGIAGRRVLVLDDTWVTGARARSAAHVLTRAEAAAVGIVVVGRSVDPESSPGVSRWWERCLAQAADRDGRCGWAGCPGAGEGGRGRVPPGTRLASSVALVLSNLS